MDSVSHKKRTEIMRAVKSVGNKSTELRMVRFLREHHISGWRRGSKLYGRPDFLFKEGRTAVFIDGCFWHGCKHCRRNMRPSTNSNYWLAKITRNRKRDRQVNAELRRRGWQVLRMWEHEMLKAPQTLIRRIQKTLIRGAHEKKNEGLQPRSRAGERRNP